MKKEVEKKKTQKRVFLWYALRISCFLPVVAIILLTRFNFVGKSPNLSFYFFLFTLAIIIFLSIINLIKYKKKVFAIVSLALSTILFLIFSLWAILRIIIWSD